MKVVILTIMCVAFPCFQSMSLKDDIIIPDDRQNPIGICPLNNSTSDRATLQITNHGGPIMNNAVVYVIWYGSWTATQKAIVTYFITNIGNSPWWGINSAYGTGKITLGGQYSDAGSQGTTFTGSLGGTSVFGAMAYAINNQKLPLNTNGIYLVLTSSNIVVPGFCTQMCGWHSSGSSYKLKYAFAGVPNVSTCGGCVKQQPASPNNDVGVDSMISTIAHELAETVTNPLGDAWYDANGDENADKCNSNFPNLLRLPTGAYYNIVLGTQKYLIQSNWNKNTQSCTMS